MNFIFLLVGVITCISCSSVRAGDYMPKTFNFNRRDFEAGPRVWGRTINPNCDCRRQSPINIKKRDVKFGANFSLEFIYEHAEVEGKLENNGFVPEFLLKEPEYHLKGVPNRKEDLYQLDQFHFHFGRNDREGSEHKNGWRAASGESRRGSNAPKLDSFLTENLPLIREMGREVETSFSPIDMLPSNGGFYTYCGSLTTPPCAEVVQWIVFRSPISLTRKTFRLFRRLETRRGLMGRFGNVRPIQRLNGRLIEANFDC